MFRTIECSLALTGLTHDQASPAVLLQTGLTAAARAGCRAVQLDGAATGMRARELDRSARRDIAAKLRRHGLAFTGIDLWIPERHFSDPQHVDRAVVAVTQACGLAGDLARLVAGGGPGSGGGGAAEAPCVCITLPAKRSAEVAASLASAAMVAGVVIADFQGASDEPVSVLGVGFDPASEILARRDPVQGIGENGGDIRNARLTDATGRGRTAVGRGSLDVAAYKAIVRTVTGLRHVVVDVRDLADPESAARLAVEAWTEDDGMGG